MGSEVVRPDGVGPRLVPGVGGRLWGTHAPMIARPAAGAQTAIPGRIRASWTSPDFAMAAIAESGPYRLLTRWPQP